MTVIEKGILPLRFKANGVASGIKRSGKLDLGLIFSEIPAKASCLFTTNAILAAPVKVCKDNLRRGRHFQAIIANSGNANCFTQDTGVRDAKETVKYLAKALFIKEQEALVASTGIIGKRLEPNKIKKALPELIKGLSKSGINKAAESILTTDTFSKQVSVKCNVGGSEIIICGIAKGAGMISPNMATMLCFILTDANIAKGALDKALRSSVENTFNCITVDGCMSTNDSVMVLANGAAGNPIIEKGKSLKLFGSGLNLVCLKLAKMIVSDAEGASKFIQINVVKAATFAEAKKAGLAIANSNLFKTAVYGRNPNFGRIVAAVGAAGIKVKENDLEVNISPLKKKNIVVDVTLKTGRKSATVYTSDLTPEYIKINAEYS